MSESVVGFSRAHFEGERGGTHGNRIAKPITTAILVARFMDKLQTSTIGAMTMARSRTEPMTETAIQRGSMLLGTVVGDLIATSRKLVRPYTPHAVPTTIIMRRCLCWLERRARKIPTARRPRAREMTKRRSLA